MGSYFLMPIAWLYGLVLTIRNMAYDHGWKKQHPVSVPVISVGNITAGGTGKTPMAEFLLGKLLEMGHTPSYLSRGYGRETSGFFIVDPENGDAKKYGDEAFQVANRFPQLTVAVCENRVEGANRLLEDRRIDFLVLDDAFQHRRIQRDIDLVMVDCTRPPTKDFILPAGRLREKLSGLNRANVFVFSKFQDASKIKAIQDEMKVRWPKAKQMVMDFKPLSYHHFLHSDQACDLDDLEGLPVIAFSGIGNNGHFSKTLSDLGLNVMQFFPFPDHYAYQKGDMEKILRAFEAQKEIKGKLPPALILTTEKDFFRLKKAPWMAGFENSALAFVKIGMEVRSGWEQIEQELKEITSGRN